MNLLKRLNKQTYRTMCACIVINAFYKCIKYKQMIITIYQKITLLFIGLISHSQRYLALHMQAHAGTSGNWAAMRIEFDLDEKEKAIHIPQNVTQWQIWLIAFRLMEWIFSTLFSISYRNESIRIQTKWHYTYKTWSYR